jgi:hypothetical protein
MTYYQHLDSEGKESKELTKEELERMQGKSSIPKKDLKRMLKNFDKNFPDEVDIPLPNKKSSRKRPWIRKPTYDPSHHHDSHLIN